MIITNQGKYTNAQMIRDFLRDKAHNNLLYMKFGSGVQSESSPNISSLANTLKRVKVLEDDINGVSIVYDEEQIVNSNFTKVRVTAVLENPIYNNTSTSYTEFGLVIYPTAEDATNDTNYTLYLYGTHTAINIQSNQTMYVKNAYINF